jgi:hypothetical protein
MAQTGYSVLSLYYSATATNVPTAGNLVAGELAINTADGKLFYKDSAGVVQTIAGKGGAGVAGGSNTQVQYNSSGSLAGSANMTFNGTTLTLANDASISGLTVGKGGASVNSTTVGYQAGNTGTSNYATMVGYQAGYSNTDTAQGNAFIGWKSGYANTSGNSNVALGTNSFVANTTGSFNISLGQQSLFSNTTASNNTAVGYQAGYSNTTGVYNVYFGQAAGYSATTGTSYSCFIGAQAGQNTTGTQNHFFGQGAGQYVTSGAKNVILGGYGGNSGGLDIRTASNYIVLSDGDGNPRQVIGSGGGVSIGRVDNPNSLTGAYLYVQGVYDNTTGSAANVFVNSNGALVRSTSSLKYKTDVQDAIHGLEDLLKLRPVTYKGKSEQDGDTVFGGLIAEEVDVAGLTEFVQYADDGSPDALAYGNMVSLCIKAIQELKAEFDEYKATHP